MKLYFKTNTEGTVIEIKKEATPKNLKNIVTSLEIVPPALAAESTFISNNVRDPKDRIDGKISVESGKVKSLHHEGPSVFI